MKIDNDGVGCSYLCWEFNPRYQSVKKLISGTSGVKGTLICATSGYDAGKEFVRYHLSHLDDGDQRTVLVINKSISGSAPELFIYEVSIETKIEGYEQDLPEED